MLNLARAKPRFGGRGTLGRGPRLVLTLASFVEKGVSWLSNKRSNHRTIKPQVRWARDPKGACEGGAQRPNAGEGDDCNGLCKSN